MCIRDSHGLGKRQFAQLYGYGMLDRFGKGQLVVIIFYAQSLEQKTNAALLRADIENIFFQYVADKLEFIFQGFLFLSGFQLVQSFLYNRELFFNCFLKQYLSVIWDIPVMEFIVFRYR